VDLLKALDAATEEFSRRLALVHVGMLGRPTPCPDWNVQYLVAHVVGGNRFGELILDGMPSSKAIELVMSSPQLGDDIMAAWTVSSAAQSAAFRSSTGLTRRVDHPFGEITAREFLAFRVFDITLHTWDLARAIGGDEQLAPDLVDAIIAIVEQGPPGMGFGIAALGLAPSNASPQVRLLDMTGRRS
jgi:uncharacterized protein (TIGR03086 family)